MSIARPRLVPVVALLVAFSALLLIRTGAAHSQPAKGGSVVKLAKTALGQVLVDARGRTLYLYTPDHKNTSVCYGKCASFWPPLLTTAKPRAGKGANASLLGETMRKDGKHQVTYAGHPLYFFANDKKAGQTNGQGLQKIWWVVSAAGKKVTAKAPVAPAPPATVQLASTSLGPVLVDATGKTLYLFTPDTTSASTCYGQCATNWPPLLVTGGTPTVGTGLDSSLVGTTTRTDGTVQVTYAGHPLYFFAKDAKAGDTNGEGVGSIWYAVSASGNKV